MIEKKLSDLELSVKSYARRAKIFGYVENTKEASGLWLRLQDILNELKQKNPERFGQFSFTIPKPLPYRHKFLIFARIGYSKADFTGLQTLIKNLKERLV